MQSIGAKVRVGDDRKITLQLPEALPQGEYEVMVVLNPVDKASSDALEADGEETEEKSIAERWKKWFEAVDQLPLKEDSEEKSFHQHLVDEHCQLALESIINSPRKFGQFRGQIQIADDFDSPLPDEFWIGKL